MIKISFFNNQHGFLNKKSTPAVFSYYSQLINYIETGECQITVFCDVCQAFDCVNQEPLLKKLNIYGIRGTALNWNKDSIIIPKQYVVVENISL